MLLDELRVFSLFIAGVSNFERDRKYKKTISSEISPFIVAAIKYGWGHYGMVTEMILTRWNYCGLQLPVGTLLKKQKCARAPKKFYLKSVEIFS